MATASPDPTRIICPAICLTVKAPENSVHVEHSIIMCKTAGKTYSVPEIPRLFLHCLLWWLTEGDGTLERFSSRGDPQFLLGPAPHGIQLTFFCKATEKK